MLAAHNGEQNNAETADFGFNHERDVVSGSENPNQELDQSEEFRLLAATLRQRLRESEIFMYTRHKAWFRSIATVTGLQQPFNNRGYFRRLTSVNQILPILRTSIAKVTKNKPRLLTVPASNTKQAKDAARVSDRALEAHWISQRMGYKTRRMLFWMFVCNEAYLFPYWSKMRGKITNLPMMERQHVSRPDLDEEGNPKIGPDGVAMTVEDEVEMPVLDDMGQPQMRAVYLGDVDTDVVSPFEVFMWRPGVKDPEEAEIVFRKKYRDLEYITHAYPKWGGYVKPEPASAVFSTFEELLTSLTGPLEPAPFARRTRRQGAYVVECFVRPTAAYPRGRHVTISNGVILQLHDKLPYDADLAHWNPFIKFQDADMPWADVGASTVSQLQALQADYNSIRAQVAKNIKMHGNIRVYAPNGSVGRVQTNDALEIINYDPNLGPPKEMSPPGLPSHMMGMLNVITTEFETVSGQHQTSKGSVPTNVSSGLAIAYLQEQDDTRLGPTASGIEDGLALWGMRVLQLMKDHYTEPRMFAMLGRTRVQEVFSFMNTDLGDCSQVLVQPGSALPGNKIARQEFIFRLMNSGYFQVMAQNPQVARRIAQLLEFGSIEELYEELSLDEENAEQENVEMLSGKQAAFSKYDNHPIHIEKHINRIKSPDVRERLNRDEQPAAQFMQLCEEHLDLHRKAMQEHAGAAADSVGGMTGAQNAGGGGVGSLGPSGANQMPPELQQILTPGTPGMPEAPGGIPAPAGYPFEGLPQLPNG